MNRKTQIFANLFMVSDISQKLRSALELGTVVAIIMTLTAMSVRAFEIYIIRSQVSEAFMLTSLVRVEMVTFRAENGRWPSNGPALHNSTLSQESNLGKFVDYMELQDGGAISVVFNEESAAAKLQGRRLTLRPLLVSATSSGPISWVCASHQVPEGLSVSGFDGTDIGPTLLPSACREF
jgi:type IV pilus assembly protein PilA